MLTDSNFRPGYWVSYFEDVILGLSNEIKRYPLFIMDEFKQHCVIFLMIIELIGVQVYKSAEAYGLTSRMLEAISNITTPDGGHEFVTTIIAEFKTRYPQLTTVLATYDETRSIEKMNTELLEHCKCYVDDKRAIAILDCIITRDKTMANVLLPPPVKQMINVHTALGKPDLC